MVPTKPPALTDGRSARTAPPTTVAPRLGDEDAGLRKIDELAHEIRGRERALVAGRIDGPVTQGDEPIDVRDTGCSDQVFHAGRVHLAGPATVHSRPGTRPRVAPGPRSARRRRAMDARRRADGCGRPVLQSVRRCAMIRHRFGGHLRAARDEGHCATTRQHQDASLGRCHPRVGDARAGSGQRGPAGPGSDGAAEPGGFDR